MTATGALTYLSQTMLISRSPTLRQRLVLIIHVGALVLFFFKRYGDHRDLHVVTHSFPTRRSSDLSSPIGWSSEATTREASRSSSTCSSRSEEHTSELQSRNDNSYAVFCLKKKTGELPAAAAAGPPARGGRLRRGVPRAGPGFRTVTRRMSAHFFFFTDTATNEIYTSLHTLSLHDALPISVVAWLALANSLLAGGDRLPGAKEPTPTDRKSTRLNSSHVTTSRMPSSA